MPVIIMLAVYWLTLVYELGAQWSVYEQYNYGWAVPFLCAYLLWLRWRQVAGKPSAPDRQAPPVAVNGPGKSGAGRAMTITLLFVAALMYAVARFFHEANPIWRLTSLIWALAVVVFTLVLLPSTIRRADGPSPLSRSNYVFPICFFLVAVPWPSGLENWLVQTFTRLNVGSTIEALSFCNVPAIQHGNVIEVASGVVSVDAACSGIRSFQVTIMMTLFFGELYRLNLPGRGLLVLLGFIFSFLFNVARTSVLTSVSAHRGNKVMESWHDPVGVVLLVSCFLAIWGSAVWMRGRGRNRQEKVSAPVVPRFDLQPSMTRWVAVGLFAWFVVVEAGTQLWYVEHESTSGREQSWTLALPKQGNGLAPLSIPNDVLQQFKADSSFGAGGHDNQGNAWQIYYFRWQPGRSLRERVIVQLAKSHGPEICLTAVGMVMQSDLGVVKVQVGARTFAFRQYVFLANDRPVHVFYAIYEDQSGSAVLASRRMDNRSRIDAALAGSRNCGQRFLELALAGPESTDAARAEVTQELQKLLVNN